MLQKILDSFTHYWGTISAIFLGLLGIQKFLSEFFGINMLGKKIYKGAPNLWKRLMSRAVFRKDVQNALNEISKQLTTNGGTSLKDALNRIENTQAIHTELLKQQATQSSYNSLRLTLLDESNDRFIFKLDPEGGCSFINDSFLKFFGYTEKDILKFNFESIIHPDDVKNVREKINRAIETKCDLYVENRICDIGGHDIPVVVRAYPILEDGKLKEMYGTCDIKE